MARTPETTLLLAKMSCEVLPSVAVGSVAEQPLQHLGQGFRVLAVDAVAMFAAAATWSTPAH